MKNQKEHNYILYLLKKLNKKYNKSILLVYDEKCNRENIVEDNGTFILTYGRGLIDKANRKEKFWRYEIRYSILHELGHAVHNLPYNTFKEKVENEYQAERFALNVLKEMFPKTYRWSCKEGYSLLQDKKWGTSKREKHYRIAFSRIKEYTE